jgi:hypothetical protein
MGYISKPAMAEFPAMNAFTLADNGGDHPWDTNLAYATDGNVATYAAVSEKVTLGKYAKAILDLGQVFILDVIRWKFEIWANNPYANAVQVTFNVKVSLNGTDWTTIDTFTDTTTLKNSADVSVADTVEINTVNYVVRYIAFELGPIAGTGGNDNEARIYEIWAEGHPVKTTPVV